MNKVYKMIDATLLDGSLMELKLRVKAHRISKSVSAYMVCNPFGEVCGGNLRVFIPRNIQRGYDYPTIFHTMDSALAFISRDNGIQEMANYAIKNNVRMV